MRIIVALFTALVTIAVPASASHAGRSIAIESREADRALQALADVDADRIFRDATYARQMLQHLEVLRKSSLYSGDARLEIDRLRLLTLIGSGEDHAALQQAMELTNIAPGEPELHYYAFLLGVQTQSATTLDELELADRSLTSEDARRQFRDALDDQLVGYFRQPFFAAKDKTKVARSAQILLNLGWPGPDKLDQTDNLRLDAADGLLAKGDVTGARRLVFSLRSTRPVLKTLVSRKWDPLREAGDPNERLAQAIAASDEASRAALVGKPHDPEVLLSRALFLRSVGRESEALELLFPKAADSDWVKQHGENGFWVVNEAAYSLVAQKREEEAVALMQSLLSLGLGENPSLISMAINNISIMMDAGDFAGAADFATKLATQHQNLASPYGRMWMWQGAVCGHAFAGNPKSAQPWLSRLRAGERDNPAAVTRALLCVNDIDGTAASVIRRLGDDSDDLLLALQDYSAGPEPSAVKKTLEQRLQQVIARSDVQAAIAKHGRVMKVPLSRSYWGLF